MATFTPAPGLNNRLAAMLAPAVTRIAADVREAAADYAPKVGTWHAGLSACPRPWHLSADGQKCPANLKFILEHSPRAGRPHPPGNEYLTVPRDPSAHRLQREFCRCERTVSDELARSISAGRTRVRGTLVSVTVGTSFPRAAGAEFGEGELGTGARYLGRAVRDTAADLR